MLHTSTIPKSKPGRTSWPQDVLLGLLPLLLGIEVFVWIFYVPMGMRGITDFRTLYASGYMLRTHDSKSIYNDEKLAELKERIAPLSSPTLYPSNGRAHQPMDHLAYEAILFAPLSYLPYKQALLAFMLINIGVVGICLRLLDKPFAGLRERWRPLPLLLFAAFFPITRTIVQGQDSIILLALLAGALLCLAGEQDFWAGLLIGLGLFKLQIVIPIALLFLLWRRWRVVAGFAVSGVCMVALTTAIVGFRGMQQYGSMLLGMSLRLRTNEDAMRYSLAPRTMLNIRGLLSGMLEGHLPHLWLQAAIVICSLAILLVAARQRPSLPLAVVASALVSYHLNAQDASILMIPIGLALCSRSTWLAAAAVAVVILPVVAIVPLYGFIAAVPVLTFFLLAVSREENLSAISGEAAVITA